MKHVKLYEQFEKNSENDYNIEELRNFLDNDKSRAIINIKNDDEFKRAVFILDKCGYEVMGNPISEFAFLKDIELLWVKNETNMAFFTIIVRYSTDFDVNVDTIEEIFYSKKRKRKNNPEEDPWNEEDWGWEEEH